MKVIIIILQTILNLVRKRRDLIANRNKIPPEIKNSIVAIYDPASQGMTNYDVIESYAEDFTKGNVYNKNGETSIDSEKQLTITNIINIHRGLYNLVIKNVNPDFILYVKGMASDGYLRAGGVLKTSGFSFVDLHNGINKIDVSDFVTFIIEGNIAGECNITITQLPTSILKDLSGNGNHAYLYGGKGKLNSGMGVYQEDFTTYEGAYVTKHNIIELTKNKRQATQNALIMIFRPFVDKAADKSIGKVDKFLKMIQEEDGTVDIEPLLGKMTDNLIVAATKEYPDLFGGVTIGNGKIKIGIPGIDKDIVLEAADIDHFKSCLK